MMVTDTTDGEWSGGAMKIELLGCKLQTDEIEDGKYGQNITHPSTVLLSPPLAMPLPLPQPPPSPLTLVHHDPTASPSPPPLRSAPNRDQIEIERRHNPVVV